MKEGRGMNDNGEYLAFFLETMVLPWHDRNMNSHDANIQRKKKRGASGQRQASCCRHLETRDG